MIGPATLSDWCNDINTFIHTNWRNHITTQEDPARETVLYEYDTADIPLHHNRKLQSSGGLLHDKHSLAADYEELLKQEKQLQKRVAKLKPKDMLPFRVASLGRYYFYVDYLCVYMLYT